MIHPAPHHIPAAAFMGWPAIVTDGPADRARAEIAVAEAAVADLRGVYRMACRELGKANKIARGVPSLRRILMGKPLRAINVARSNLLAAERRLAALRVALDTAAGTAPDIAMAA